MKITVIKKANTAKPNSICGMLVFDPGGPAKRV